MRALFHDGPLRDEKRVVSKAGKPHIVLRDGERFTYVQSKKWFVFYPQLTWPTFATRPSVVYQLQSIETMIST